MTMRRRYGLTLLIGLLLTVYTLSNSGRFHVVDEVSLFAVTESLGLRGQVDTNAVAWTQWVNSPGEVLGAFGPEGDVYSKKGIGPALLALPWYMLLKFVTRLNIAVGLVQSTLLWNGLITALVGAIVWLSAVRLGYDDRVGAILGLLYGLATIAWPYANQFFGEPVSALGLMIAFYGLLSWGVTLRARWAFVAGAGAALAILTVTAHVLLVGLLALYAVATTMLDAGGAQSDVGRTMPDHNREPAGDRTSTLIKGLALFAAPGLVAAAALLWYNFARFGNPFETGYHFGAGEGFTTPVLDGLYGLLLSPYRGVFWFTPLFFASVAAFIPFIRRHRLEGILIGGMSAVLLVLYSVWWMWWAGFAWGPRFLVPMAPFGVLLLAPVVEGLVQRVAAAWRDEPGWRQRLRAPGVAGWLLIGLAAVSLVVQAASVTVNFVNYEILLRSLYPTDWSDPLAFGPPAQSLGDLLDSPVAGQFNLMQLGLAANTDLAWLWQDGNIQLLVLMVGGAVLLTLLGLSYGWWRTASDGTSELPSRPVRWLAVVLPILFIGLWSSEVSRHPHYGDVGRGYRAVIEEICAQARPTDAIVTVAPYAYQIPMNWMGSACRHAPPVYGYAPDSLQQEEALAVMARTLDEYERIWFVTGGLPPNDPENTLERWLADTSFKAFDAWYEDFRLLAYATPLAVEDVPLTELNVPLVGNRTSEIIMIGARMPEAADAGDTVPIEIRYRSEAPNEADLRWFVQMLTGEGYPVALLDTGPDDGYTPFSSLPSQEELVERAGLLLPPDLPAGQYNVIAGLYNPDSPELERLRAPDGSDYVELGTLVVRGQENE